MEYTAEQKQYQQQYQNQPQAYGYDPSQYHHQPAASYYAYAYGNQQHQQQQYPYYPPQDSYPQRYSQFYQEVPPIHPPGVPLDHHSQPAVYYPPQPAEDPQHQQGIPVSGSDSSAAPVNYAGNVVSAQRDNRPRQVRVLLYKYVYIRFL